MDSPPQQSLSALADAIQAVFAGPSREISNKSVRRTVLDRSDGQIITEKDVIERLEERKNKQDSKRKRSLNPNSNRKKQFKKGK